MELTELSSKYILKLSSGFWLTISMILGVRSSQIYSIDFWILLKTWNSTDSDLILKLCRSLNSELLSYLQVTERTVETKRDNMNVKVTIKLTCELPPNNPVAIQVKNLMINKLSYLMDFVQVGRNWYDANNAISLQRHG